MKSINSISILFYLTPEIEVNDMSYSDVMTQLIQQAYFTYVVILDPNGAIYWTNNQNWQVDGEKIMSSWKSREPSITVGGTRFSSLMNNPGESYVGRNLAGGGTIVLQKAPNGYSFLTWSSSETQIQPINIHAEVFRMAMLFT